MEILLAIALLAFLAFLLKGKKKKAVRNIENMHDTRELFYQNNSDIISSVELCAALDFRTCLVCGVLDGTRYKLDESHPKPPIHHQCRCVLLPVTDLTDLVESSRPAEVHPTAFFAEQRYNSQNHKKKFADLAHSTQKKYIYAEQKILYSQGIKVYKQVNWNYRQWFARLPEKYKKIVVGDKRLKLMKKFNLKLDDLVDIASCREYSIEELNQKYKTQNNNVKNYKIFAG